MPDRVLRQFGREKSRPLDVIKPTYSRRSSTRKGEMTYALQFDTAWDRWGDRYNHLCPHINDSPLVEDPWSVDSDYFPWFYTISHPYVYKNVKVNPAPLNLLSRDIDAHRRLALGLSLAHWFIDHPPTREERICLANVLAGVDQPEFAPEPYAVVERRGINPSVWERGESSRMEEERAQVEEEARRRESEETRRQRPPSDE